MRFCCPECGREEEILLERRPLCLFCRAKMIPESDYSDVWLSPGIAITRMRTISEKYGTEKARTDGRFKKEREAWTTAVFALALTKLTGEQWWVEIETRENTPDTRLRRLEQCSGNNVIQARSIEVVDWDEHVEDIMEVIKKKCGRSYPEHYILLVHARNSEKLLDFDRVIEEMKHTRSPFLEVWVLAFESPQSMKVARVAPSALLVDLNVQAELRGAAKQRGFLRKGIRGTGTAIQDLGPAYVPIP